MRLFSFFFNFSLFHIQCHNIKQKGNDNQAVLKNFKPKINLNHNIPYIVTNLHSVIKGVFSHCSLSYLLLFFSSDICQKLAADVKQREWLVACCTHKVCRDASTFILMFKCKEFT